VEAAPTSQLAARRYRQTRVIDVGEHEKRDHYSSAHLPHGPSRIHIAAPPSVYRGCFEKAR